MPSVVSDKYLDTSEMVVFIINLDAMFEFIKGEKGNGSYSTLNCINIYFSVSRLNMFQEKFFLPPALT